MARSRLLVIGLDGYEFSLAERFMEDGALPHLAELRNHSARYFLDHGFDKNSGLAWEHVSSGRSPIDNGRWSAIRFDRAHYTARQEPTSAQPFVANLSARTVVFDTPYFDLSRAPSALGITNWGAHDPGIATNSRPAGLFDELNRRFGPYPAKQWIYAFCWPSADKTRVASDALVRAVKVRAQAAGWLLTERLPDWDLALVVVAETHSASEPLWHGTDPSHPLNRIPSAAAAATGLRDVYIAVDTLIGDLKGACPDATLMVFAMHGMGPNDADVPSMVLLPELLYRATFGRPYMRPAIWSARTPEGIPLLAIDDVWEKIMLQVVPTQPPVQDKLINRILRRIGSKLYPDEDKLISRILRRVPIIGSKLYPPDESGIYWMPAYRYARFWPQMQAFALPAYYDGRVRINLQGREAKGIVSRGEYKHLCEQTTRLLHDCRNLLTGRKAVAEVHQPKQDPFDVGETEADLYVIWQEAPAGLSTSEFGTIGPIPYRRTGGHTGSNGFMYVSGSDIAPYNGGVVSSFDVVPTIIELLGERRPAGISGRSLAGDLLPVSHAGEII
jgi:predicted AlkP superfamily phosphohydrolase/phosphomutase